MKLFSTKYKVSKSIDYSFKYLVNIVNYTNNLPQFRNAKLVSDDNPICAGKQFFLFTSDVKFNYETIITIKTINGIKTAIFLYEYKFKNKNNEPQEGSPMPWTTAMVKMDLEATESGTTISTKMTVEGVTGLFSKMKIYCIRPFCTMSQKVANKKIAALIDSKTSNM